MKKLKIISVVGARPNFIKIAPIHKEFLLYADRVIHKICHTGQHFDVKMSKVFFDELELPRPDFYLGIGSASHAVQTAKIMMTFEKIIEQEKPDIIIVPGDVNSTLACSLVASKMGIRIAHVEAGLRSFDNTMPEEINRKVTDLLSDFLFVSENSGLINLRKEGVDSGKIFFTGNVMIDSLIQYLPGISQSNVVNQMGLKKKDYILATFHRPSNVDDPRTLANLVHMLNRLSDKKNLVFPVHPRTISMLKTFGLIKQLSSGIKILEPLGYIDFIAVTMNAMMAITDSGGIQEETTWLGVPCITVRNNTERPSTVEVGTNILAGTNLSVVEEVAIEILSGKLKKGSIPELWDGKASSRIVRHILNQT